MLGENGTAGSVSVLGLAMTEAPKASIKARR